MLPYEVITETADRRWTFRLLDRLIDSDLPVGEPDELITALQAVSDRRAVPVLERILTDPASPAPTREAAGDVLRGMQYLDIEWPESKLREWWAGDDAILRRHALLAMDVAACPDIIRSVAADPTDPLRTAALGRMTFFFDTPTDLRLKVATLADADPAIREVAAAILFWDEPVVAEGPLLTAAVDAVTDVAVDAIATLRYYPTRRVIRCLHGMLDHPTERVRDAARESFEDIRSNCLLRLHDQNPRVVTRIRGWLEPVWDRLAFAPEELSPPEREPFDPPTTQLREPPPASEMLAMLADPDSSPKRIDKCLWADGWDQYPESDRRRLRPLLLNHDDPLVRDRATVPLEAWGNAAGLLALAGDPDFGVRKSAFYRLGLLPTDRQIAAVAWLNLARPDVFGTHARETLGTYVAHADPAEAIPWLSVIAADRAKPEDLRVAAVHDLARFGAVVDIGRLLNVLAESPAVTWALHIAVLDAAAGLGLKVDVGPLADVDHLDVQAAVGEFDGQISIG